MTFILAHDTARARAIDAIRTAPDGWVVTIKEPIRTLSQNAKFHTMCMDFKKSGIEWAGRKRDEHEWKVILVSGFCHSVGVDPEIIRGLEGEPVALRESTAKMPKSRKSNLIEYSYAIGSELGVRWSE